jgi:ubiquitin C-terminal hydrolase
MLYEEKKKSQQLFVNGKYYLVNQEYYNYFKKMYNYNLISKIISPYEPENLKNLYTFIKKVPSNKLDMYWNYKMEEVLFDKNSESYYMVEPESIIVNYNKDKQVISYDNFLLIDEKSGKAFSDNKESSHICCECTFIDGKIIIDLPNYLNHSGMVPKCVSIIGNLYVDKCFKIEYILIYVTEAGRKNHLDSIKNNLKENLRNLKFKDNIYTFNFQSNEVTIIKYKKKDNFKLETYFKQRPKIGLDNIGATCYMNSTLQCLTHIDSLVDYFKYDPQIEEVKQNHQNLSSSFKTLVDNLYPDILTSNRYAPNDFKEKISVMNPLFKGIAANDAKDLVNFIIMTLHNELNKKDEIPDENKDLPQNPDQSNKEQSYLSFENEILREHRSIISDLFYGINRNETQCCNCGKNIYNYQTYFFINFPLEVVRQYRAQKMSNNMMFPMNQMNQLNSNEVDIIDCFENEERITTLAGENSMYCNGCRQNAPSNMRTVLITGPEELILILNRGKGKEFDIKLNFTENLNLYKFIEKKETGYKYKLTGVITHLGESSMSGHFIAFCIDQTNKKWYKYNDSMVDEIKDFEKEVVNNSNIMPYLLFYHKLNQTKK